jgi:hypothetical protein
MVASGRMAVSNAQFLVSRPAVSKSLGALTGRALWHPILYMYCRLPAPIGQTCLLLIRCPIYL